MGGYFLASELEVRVKQRKETLKVNSLQHFYFLRIYALSLARKNMITLVQDFFEFLPGQDFAGPLDFRVENFL